MKIGIKKVNITQDNGRLNIVPARAFDPSRDKIENCYIEQIDIRDALTQDHAQRNCEVWLFPWCSEQGLIEFSRKFSIDDAKEQFNIDIKACAVFIDIDDKQAHQDTRPSEPSFFNALEAELFKEGQSLKDIQGTFYYRTLRGARVGWIYEKPQTQSDHYYVREFLFNDLATRLQHIDSVEVDKACLNDNRGFTAPHGLKVIKDVPQVQRITAEQAQLFIHENSLSDHMFQVLLKASLESVKSAQSAERSDDVSDKSKQRKNPSKTAKRDKKHKSVFVPQDIDHLDNTEQYNLSRALIYKISNFVHHRELRLDILRCIDRHIMDGRRSQKEPNWFEREIESLDHTIPLEDHDAIIGDVPPEAVKIEEFSELLPLNRIFERGDDLELAETVLDAFGCDPLPLWHGDGLRKYDEKAGIWRFYGSKTLKRIAMMSKGAVIQGEKGMTQFKVTNAKVKASVDMISALRGFDGSHTPFDSAPCGIVLNDTFVTVVSGQIKLCQIAPAYYAIHKLDIDIPTDIKQHFTEQGGTAPQRPVVFCDTYLKRSLTRELADHETQDDLDKEIEAKITTILEWLGLALLGLCTSEAVALIVHGEGSNGKSVLTSLVADLFGDEQTSHLPPQNMSERFSRAQLFGSLINIVSEMPEHELIASDTIKAVISGDKIEVERKHQDPFSFIPRAGHIFSCNNLPASRDRSYGLWRRFIPVKFEHVFRGSERDKELKNKLRAEYDLIVLYAIEYARQYLKRGGFKYQSYINLWRWDWRGQTDQIATFFEETCEIVTDTNEYTATKDIYQAFKTWSEEHSNGTKMSRIKFTKSIVSLPTVTKKKVKQSGKVINAFNVKIKQVEEPSAWK